MRIKIFIKKKDNGSNLILKQETRNLHGSYFPRKEERAISDTNPTEENLLKKANKGDQYTKVPDYIKGTLTRKLYEKMSAAALDAVEDYADKKLNPVDIDLTSDHFFDRLNDPRNKKDISGAELIGFFKRLAKTFNLPRCGIPILTSLTPK